MRCLFAKQSLSPFSNCWVISLADADADPVGAAIDGAIEVDGVDAVDAFPAGAADAVSFF